VTDKQTDKQKDRAITYNHYFVVGAERKAPTLWQGVHTVPRTQTATGQRSFAVNGPRTWNSLPADLRTPDTTLCSFKRHLKARLFQQ